MDSGAFLFSLSRHKHRLIGETHLIVLHGGSCDSSDSYDSCDNSDSYDN